MSFLKLELTGKERDFYLNNSDKAKLQSPVFREQLQNVKARLVKPGYVSRNERSFLSSIISFTALNNIYQIKYSERVHNLLAGSKDIPPSIREGIIEAIDALLSKLESNQFFAEIPSLCLIDEKTKCFYMFGGRCISQKFSQHLLDAGASLICPNEATQTYSVIGFVGFDEFKSGLNFSETELQQALTVIRYSNQNCYFSQD